MNRSPVYEVLKSNNHVGKANGVKTENLLQELGRAVNGATRRKLLQEIQLARRNGEFIISDTTNGYYLPANAGEIERWCNAQKSRALNAFATAKAMKGYLKEHKANENQAALF